MSALSHYLERREVFVQEPQKANTQPIPSSENKGLESASSWAKLRTDSYRFEANRLGISVRQLENFLTLNYPQLEGVSLDQWTKRNIRPNAIFKFLPQQDLSILLASLWPYIHVQSPTNPEIFADLENFKSDSTRYQESLRCLQSLQNGPQDNGFFSKNIAKIQSPTTHLPIKSFVFYLRTIISKIEKAPLHLISDNVDDEMGKTVRLRFITKEEAKRNAKNLLKRKW